MEQGKLIELILTGLPYPDQIKNLDLGSEKEAVRFEWRNAKYRVSGSGFVEEIGNGVLMGSDKAILMRHLFEKSRILAKV